MTTVSLYKTCELCRPTSRDVNYADNKGKTLLMGAAQRGHLTCTKSLIAAGAKVNVQDKSGDTALIRATQTEESECMRTLIASGADVNMCGYLNKTALLDACQDGYLPGVEILLKGGAHLNEVENSHPGPPLLAAVMTGNLKIVDFLLNWGDDVHRQCIGKTMLMLACDVNHSKIVKRLIVAGADVNKVCEHRNETALHMGIKSEKIVKMLLEAGADVNIPVNNPPLFSAVEGSRNVDLLVKAGADVNASNSEGISCLYEAARCGSETNVDILIKAGANPNSVTGTVGCNPLHIAACQHNYRTVKALIEAGAGVNAADEHGMTPLLLSLCWDDPRVNYLKVLFGAGAHTTWPRPARLPEPPPRSCMLLYAGGMHGLKTHFEDTKEYKEQVPCEVNLKHLARNAIRNHLVALDNKTNLFLGIPLLGLPGTVNDYLLFGQNLELEDEDDMKEEDSDSEYNVDDDDNNSVDDDDYQSFINDYMKSDVN